MEGFKRNKYYLNEILDQNSNILFLFVQEHWLPDYEAKNKFSKAFQSYEFLTTSSDTFYHPEETLFQNGPVWHGSAIGWPRSINIYVQKLPIVCERFCGVKYMDPDKSINIVSYSVYLPTSGLDDEFGEIISLLSLDISQNQDESSTLIIGMDSNQGNKSTQSRTFIMNNFLERFCLKTTHVNDVPTFHHNNNISSSQIDHIYI